MGKKLIFQEKPKQDSLTTIFKSNKTLSLEINFKNKIDLDVLSKKQFDFVSIPWIGDYEGYHLKQKPPIILAQELISKNVTVLLHIPCRKLSLAVAHEMLNIFKKIGVRNILAVKGEGKNIEENCRNIDFPHTSDFVEFVSESFINDFNIGVAAYPQKHPCSTNMQQEMEFLSLKVSKGADFILTQGCVDSQILSDFHRRCKAHGIRVPIIVGTFSLRSLEQLDLLRKCKIPVENDLFQFREEVMKGPVTFESFFRKRLREVVEMVRDDKNNKFAGIHFFSFKDTELISEIMGEIELFKKKYQSIQNL